MGVNLPARLVVIKGTRRYIGSEAEDASGYQEYERSTCLQVSGWVGKWQVGGWACMRTCRQAGWYSKRYSVWQGGALWQLHTKVA